MAAFRYRGREAGGAAVSGLIEAESRQGALRLLAERGLFPSSLEPATNGAAAPVRTEPAEASPPAASQPAPARRGRVSRREITAFTREMATLLEATIPIPQALQSLGSEEENPALRSTVLDIASRVRRGTSLSSALESHPRLFPPLYSSMVRVGEEAGALPKVMTDLADLYEREDEARSEVLGAVAYPAFVLGFGVVTTFVLLAFVLPRIFTMLEEMVDVLPLPTRVLLEASAFLKERWPWLLGLLALLVLGLRAFARSESGGLRWDAWKLKLPLVGSVFRSSGLSRFARTLGILAKSGVSLLPALEIVRNTIGNRHLARSVERVAEETRGGDSLASPLRKLGLFPPTLVQMVAVGEETGRLDEMLLKVATVEERQMRARSRALISLLAPALILVVGAVVGFIVVAVLLPIFKMSQTIR